MQTLHNKIKSKIIENLLFCIWDIFITYRPLYLYILTVFETILNCREKNENNVSKACTPM